MLAPERVIMLQQMQFRSVAAVKTAMNSPAGTLLAAHQDAAATAHPMAVGALLWGRGFFPAPASPAQATHQVVII